MLNAIDKKLLNTVADLRVQEPTVHVKMEPDFQLIQRIIL